MGVSCRCRQLGKVCLCVLSLTAVGVGYVDQLEDWPNLAPLHDAETLLQSSSTAVGSVVVAAVPDTILGGHFDPAPAIQADHAYRGAVPLSVDDVAEPV